ncbi:MAG TPA: hypothetical protein VM782_01255 [Stellaceae bacterium]|nr:hypothetical protein [Stellaceae bacterium]
MPDTADVDQLWGFPLCELVLMKCPCCHTDLEDHSLTEAMRCGQEVSKKRPGAKPNAEGCQSRLYWSHGVAAKCCLAETHDGEHHNGTRTWDDEEAIDNAARFGREVPK